MRGRLGMPYTFALTRRRRRSRRSIFVIAIVCAPHSRFVHAPACLATSGCQRLAAIPRCALYPAPRCTQRHAVLSATQDDLLLKARLYFAPLPVLPALPGFSFTTSPL